MTHKEKIKILQVITSTVGGAGMHMADLSQNLDANSFDVRVAFTPGQHLDYRFYEMGVDVLHLEMGRKINIRGMWRDFRLLKKYIEQNKIDIVHTHNTLAGLIGRLAGKMAGAPVIVHMIHTFAANPTESKTKKIVFLQLERLMDKLTTSYIAGSNFIRNKAIKLKVSSEEKIQTIYYAVDMDQFLQVDVSPSCIDSRRKELGLSKDDFVIGFVGRLEKQKAPDIFIDAVARVFKVFPNVKALLIGDGHLRESLVEQCHALNVNKNIIFLGWCQDIPELLSTFDVFCVPSRWEAFGIVFAEASIMGVPIVATNNEGIPEVVVDGKSGILVDTDSPEQVAEALMKFLEGPELVHDMGQYGKSYVSNKFTLNAMVNSHADMYRRLIDIQL